MNKTSQTAKKRKRNFYITTAITTVLVIVIIAISVLLAYELPIQYDMTTQKLFTLSGQSETILDELDQTVQIAAVYPEGKEEMMVVSLLGEYTQYSSDIQVEYIDIEKNPTALEKYSLAGSVVTSGSVIVKAGDRVKVIDSTSLFGITTDGNMFNGEREISGAIRYITTEELPVVYFVEGHGEASPTAEMAGAASSLQLSAYDVKSLSLVQSGGVPEDADVIIFASPKTDITLEEKEMLEEYLKIGGKMMVMVDPVTNTNTIQLTNLNDLLNVLGIDITNNLVVEENAQNHLSDMRTYLIPTYGMHEITQAIGEDKKLVILPEVRALGTMEYDKEIVHLSPLLYSTDKSWVRPDMSIPGAEKTEFDLPGPAILGYAAIQSNVKWGNPSAQVVVLGNSSFAQGENITAYANEELFLNSVDWLQGERDDEIIAGKSINANRLLIRGDDFTKLLVICIGVVPFIAFAGAGTVWFTRRNQ